MPKAKTTKRSERIAGEDSGSKRAQETGTVDEVGAVSESMQQAGEESRSSNGLPFQVPDGPKRIVWRNCCFTINNPRKDGNGVFLPLMAKLDDKLAYIVWSLEKGENGTPHYQGYLELKKQVESKDAGPIKKILGYPGAHIEKRRGSARQAADYCKKLDETHVDGPWEFGEISHQGISETDRLEKEELNAHLADIKEGYKNLKDVPIDLIRSCPNAIKLALTLAPLVRRENVDVYYIEGPTGIGKTWNIFEKFPDAYRPIVSGDKVWFDGYDGQETLLLDELRGNIKMSFLLQLLDPYPLKVEIKGGMVPAKWKRVFITTNTPPEKWYPHLSSEDPRTFSALLRRIGHTPLSPRYAVVDTREALQRWFTRCFVDPTALDPDTSPSVPVPVRPPPQIRQIVDQDSLDDWVNRARDEQAQFGSVDTPPQSC